MIDHTNLPSLLRRGAALTVLAVLAAACGGGGSGSSGGASNDEPVQVSVVAGMSGAAATVAKMWDRGARLAAEDINADGGILGRQIEVSTIDTQTSPPQSIAAMRRALQQDPYVVMGTVFSSSTIVNMSTLGQAGVPQFTGSESTDITVDKKPKHLFRTSANNDRQLEALQGWLAENVQPKSAAILYVNDEAGQDARDSFATVAEGAGIKLVGKLSTEVGQADFTGVLTRIQRANPDVVLTYLHEEEAARFFTQFQQQNLDTQIIGLTPVVTTSVLNLAEGAADGVQGLVVASGAAPPLQDLAQRAQEKYGVAVDHNFFKAYTGMWAVKYATEEIGEFDQQKLIDYLHGQTFCVSKYPKLFSNTHWNDVGDIDRDTYVVEVRDGKQEVIETVPPLHPENFEKCQ